MPTDAPTPAGLAALRRVYHASMDADLHVMRQAATLIAIAEQPGDSTAAIAARMSMGRGAATRTIPHLAAAGLVTNRLDPADNRLRIVEPTAAGWAMIANILWLIDQPTAGAAP